MKGISLVFVLLFGLACSSTVPHLMGLKKVPRLQQGALPGVLNFTSGLIKGLELDTNSPGACTNDLAGAESDVQAVVSDIVRIIGGDEMAVVQLLTDGEALLGDLEGSNGDCKWSALLAEFETLSTAAGRSQILSNVLGNVGEIVSDAKDLANCPTNLFECGFDIAQIFTVVFDWKISTPRTKFTIDFKYLQTSGFLDGFVNGIETPSSDGTCVTDLEGDSTLVETIISEVESVISGDIAAALEAFANIKTLISDVEGFNGECNLLGLVSEVESLGSLAGWVEVAQNVVANLGSISSAASAIPQCTTNPTACGFSIGEILRLSLGWSLGPPQSVKLTQNNVVSWFDGFLSGLQTNPNASDECVSDLTSLTALVQTLVSDIENLSNDYTLVFQVISDAKTLINDLQTYQAPCNVPELVDILNSLLTPTGIQTVVTNFEQNLVTIMSDSQAILTCGTNVTLCGQNVGTIIRLVLGWSI